MISDVFRDGRVHVKARGCSTCIFRAGNLMALQEGRVEQMCRDADEAHSAIVCHDTLDQTHQAICRGYFDRRSSMTVRLALALDLVEFVT